jgi:hypothetical protein
MRDAEIRKAGKGKSEIGREILRRFFPAFLIST